MSSQVIITANHFKPAPFAGPEGTLAHRRVKIKHSQSGSATCGRNFNANFRRQQHSQDRKAQLVAVHGGKPPFRTCQRCGLNC
jgi:hypothetical protein